MRCRCSDIEQERKKISKLETQARRLEKHAGYQVELEDDITDMERNVIQCLEDATPDGLHYKLYPMTDELEPLRKQINTGLSDKIEELQTRLAGMRSEDTAWHEEQERIAEEQRCMAAAMLAQPK